ncbi:MAG TPA: ABC transporter permease [Candidatus Polarisedimenticolaceae bacterium]
MSGLLALVRRELRSQLHAPTAWIVAALFLFLSGWFFFNLVWQFAALVRSYGLYAQMTGTPDVADRLNVNAVVVEGLFSNVLVLFLFLVPALSMRAYAEERKLGTDELLLTAPVGATRIVLGKYLGLLFIAGVLLAATGVYLALVVWRGDPETGPIVSGFVGLALALGALCALGLAVSTLTSSQMMAAVGSFVVFLGLYVVGWPADSVEGWARQVLRGLSLPARFDAFSRGLVTTPDLAYFLSLIVLGLVTARLAIASQRWR